MVQNTDTYMGTHTHMGEARVLAHTRIWATRTRMGSPYAYRYPIRIWAASTRMGCPYAYGAAYTRIWAEYLYGTEHKYHYQYINAIYLNIKHQCRRWHLTPLVITKMRLRSSTPHILVLYYTPFKIHLRAANNPCR